MAQVEAHCRILHPMPLALRLHRRRRGRPPQRHRAPARPSDRRQAVPEGPCRTRARLSQRPPDDSRCAGPIRKVPPIPAGSRSTGTRRSTRSPARLGAIARRTGPSRSPSRPPRRAARTSRIPSPGSSGWCAATAARTPSTPPRSATGTRTTPRASPTAPISARRTSPRPIACCCGATTPPPPGSPAPPRCRTP